MTHKSYLAKAQNIDIQIAHLYEEKRLLESQYIEERRIIDKDTDVIFEGRNYWFTGNCEIDKYGNLLYELDGKDRYLIYKLFEDLEVVE